jgi:hypothetical protein
MGEKRNTYGILVGKPQGKRPLVRRKRRWVDNVNMDLGEIVWGCMDWIDWLRIRTREGSCEHGDKPSGSMNFWEVLE